MRDTFRFRETGNADGDDSRRITDMYGKIVVCIDASVVFRVCRLAPRPILPVPATDGRLLI